MLKVTDKYQFKIELKNRIEKLKLHKLSVDILLLQCSRILAFY